MTNINFNEPSKGEVSSDNDTALEIKTSGKNSTCISCSSKGIGVQVEGGEVFGDGGVGVLAIGHGPTADATGVKGRSDHGIGVVGI
jgi:hypothetical protein